jgi:hypothetical protein
MKIFMANLPIKTILNSSRLFLMLTIIPHAVLASSTGDWVTKASTNLVKIYAQDVASALHGGRANVHGVDQEGYDILAQNVGVMLGHCTMEFIESFPPDEKKYLLTRAAWDSNLRGFHTSVETLLRAYETGGGEQSFEATLSALETLGQCVDASLNAVGIRSPKPSECQNEQA